MVDYIELLKQDLVEQFKEKPVIDALMEAIGRQLNDVRLFFEDLKTKRSVEESMGKQLDGVGDIVVLTRKEAGELACIPESVFVLEDDEYRRFLIYKIWKNTNRCTYYDIIHSFQMFWDKPLYYREDEEQPATMIFETDELAPEDNAQALLNAPFVKAAASASRSSLTPLRQRCAALFLLPAYSAEGIRALRCLKYLSASTLKIR